MRVRDQVHKANEIMFGKGWTDEARESAAESRGKVKGDRPKETVGHQWGKESHPPFNGSPETKAKLDAAYNDVNAEANKPYDDPTRNFAPVYSNKLAADHAAMKEDPGYAHAHMEDHLAGKRGIVITGKGTDESGHHYVDFHDNLYDAKGRVELKDAPTYGKPFKVSMMSPEGHTTSTNDITNTRIQMKRLYYGATDPKQTLRQQNVGGVPTNMRNYNAAAVGRRAKGTF